MRKPRTAISPEQALSEWTSSRPLATVEKFQCTLVTPMYGGGVKAGVVDTELPIRPSAVRGQLRFWWRIANGPFSSSKEMFERESAIWGGIAAAGPSASKVKVRIKGAPVKSTELCKSDSETDAGVKYAFGPSSINGVADWLKPGYFFELTLHYLKEVPEKVREEVQKAMCWWASFGGLGARTRRGFGAIRVEGIAPITLAVVKNAQGILCYSGNGSPDPQNEWKKSIGKLYEFRQKAGLGRHEGRPRPGRSYWPEPDQIRRLSGRNGNGKHQPVHEAGNIFPRAAFGLPITFEFKGTPGEPFKSELLPQGGEDRMASPLVLRPYWDGQKWRAAALLLPGWQKALNQPLRFKDPTEPAPAYWLVRPDDCREKASHIRPMLSGNALRADDPLSAFMHYFEKGQ